jgi:hypothetical protein
MYVNVGFGKIVVGVMSDSIGGISNTLQISTTAGDDIGLILGALLWLFDPEIL